MARIELALPNSNPPPLTPVAKKVAPKRVTLLEPPPVELDAPKVSWATVPNTLRSPDEWQREQQAKANERIQNFIATQANLEAAEETESVSEWVTEDERGVSWLPNPEPIKRAQEAPIEFKTSWVPTPHEVVSKAPQNAFKLPSIASLFAPDENEIGAVFNAGVTGRADKDKYLAMMITSDGYANLREANILTYYETNKDSEVDHWGPLIDKLPESLQVAPWEIQKVLRENIVYAMSTRQQKIIIEVVKLVPGMQGMSF